MTTHELNRDQIIELKIAYLCLTQENVSYGELVDADEIVSDQTIHEYYAGTDFSDDDFCCSCH